MTHNFYRWTRRDVLKCGAAAALGSAGFRGALGLLAGAGAGAANAQAGDYKALVCVYLFGGNDGFNALVPRSAGHYAEYQAARGALAVPEAQLLALSGTDAGGRQFGLHPGMPELRDLYESGRAAFVANTGTLLAPTTKADYLAGRNLPPRLFSHNDQQEQSMASQLDAARRQGWGGKLAERLAGVNANPRLSLSISVAGNNVLQAADASVPYVIGTGGAVRMAAFNNNAAARTAYDQLLAQALVANGGNLLGDYASVLTTRSIELAAEVEAALAAGPALTTPFPSPNRLADQLRMVARLVSVRSALQMSRQLFFVSLGGFDTHDDQLIDQPPLLAQVAQAMKAFHDATVELGVDNRVAAFTLSDFGRTLGSNGDGTDHAWGNNHWVVGGPVIGGQVYGAFPSLAINGADDTRTGRLIPTTSIDQYGATLARWFGAGDSDLAVAFPHLSRFAATNLGFMA